MQTLAVELENLMPKYTYNIHVTPIYRWGFVFWSKYLVINTYWLNRIEEEGGITDITIVVVFNKEATH